MTGEDTQPASRRWTPPRVLAVLTTAGAAAMFIVAAGTPGDAAHVLQGGALTLFAVGLYATGALPEAVTALAFFAVAMLFAVAPADVVFAGFESGALWLVFAGLVIGVAVNRTGLGVALADTVVRHVGTGYARLVAGMILIGILLAFLMPSTMGRVVLLTPLVAGLADRLGFHPGTPGRTGLIMAMACGTWMPSAAILPANVPNMVLAGVAETLYGQTFTYGSYLLLHFPVTGILKALAIFAVIYGLYRDRPEPGETGPAPSAGHMTRDSRLLAVVLGVTLALWTTDFVHGISPAWIALGAAVVCLLPGLRLVPVEDFAARVNYPSVIYIAGILSLGPVLVHTGAGEVLGRALLTVLPLEPDADFRTFMSLVGLGAATGMATTAPGVPAVLGPLAEGMAGAAGMPLETVLMTQILGYSTVLLPYQVPPFILAMQLGGVPLRHGARITLVIAGVTLGVLTPLNYLWWDLLGRF